MDNLIITFFAFMAGMLMQKLAPARKPPQIIYIRAEAADKLTDAKQGAGCLPLVALVFLVCAALWLLA